MALQNEKTGEWIAANGQDVSPSIINIDDRKEDQIVERVFKHIFKLQSTIEKVHQVVDKILTAYLRAVAKRYGKKWKGSVELKDYSNTLKIRRQVNDTIEFGPKFQICEQLIREVAEDHDKEGDPVLKVLIDEGYNRNKKGKIDRHLMERILRHEIQDDKWKQARELFHESKRVVGSKEYWLFYAKPDRDQAVEYETVTLSFSKAGK